MTTGMIQANDLRRIPSVLAVFIVLLFSNGTSHAQQDVGTVFNENDRYDIYFDCDLVKSVKILGSKEINGVVFLVVHNSNLKNKATQGYIRYDRIQSILPSGYIGAFQNRDYRSN